MTTDTARTLTDAAPHLSEVLGRPVEIRPEPEASTAFDQLLEVRLAASSTRDAATLWLPVEAVAGLDTLPPEESARTIALAVEQAFAAAEGTSLRTIDEVVEAGDVGTGAIPFEIVAGDVVIPAAWDPGSPKSPDESEMEQPGPGERGLGRLADVPLDVVVEVGRAKLPIRELLALDEGGVVRLSRTVGEPVDLLVNGTLAARGDIVVVDGRLGIRVTEVLDT